MLLTLLQELLLKLKYSLIKEYSKTANTTKLDLVPCRITMKMKMNLKIKIQRKALNINVKTKDFKT